LIYQILLHPKATDFLTKTQKPLKNRIIKSLKELTSSPKEKGEQLKPSDFWKIRIGNYRAIYIIDNKSKTITVLYIGHRKNIYDNFSKLL